ncbi:MAG TPA: DUF3160 domain-containing protein, partial [Aggregatilineales bacterium]|nr:DUF3160 domain-containing protein [Aggregatilineales bacterium]
MSRRWIGLFFISSIIMLLLPFVRGASAQASCGQALPPRLQVGSEGMVSYVDGSPLNVRIEANRTAKLVGTLPEGTHFNVIDGPICDGGIYWWHIASGSVDGWAAEGDAGKYFVEPITAASSSDTTPTATPVVARATAYAGKLPTLPVSLGRVLFVKESELNSDQQKLLSQNGFVVVPASADQFDVIYGSYPQILYPANGDPTNGTTIGRPNFVTTDLMLHSLHYIFDNMLTDLEKEGFAPRIEAVISASLAAAQKQVQEVKGTALEKPANNAVLYLAVAEELFSPGQIDGVVSADIANQAHQLAQMANDATGQAPLDFLDGYVEDFSQYRPRGHYAGDADLESYFRGMMWISRITFLANQDTPTQTALLLVRALHRGKDSFTGWQTVHDMLDYLIGPVDDLGPLEYGALADKIFGTDVKNLGDAARLKAFKDALAKLPGPQINGLAEPGTTTDVSEKTKGFRFLGQRFTLDGLILQELMYPFVGTDQKKRLLPLALDVASSMGSEPAYQLAKQAGATDYANYDSQTQSLRGQLDKLTQQQWLQNTYSGWLWTLQPLLKRDAKLDPPFMQTDAWHLKDLNTALASWTELKHDTVLYAKQPTGFGGGGPPLFSYGYVEPNPLVFERLARVAAMTYQGLKTRLYAATDTGDLPP